MRFKPNTQSKGFTKIKIKEKKKELSSSSGTPGGYLIDARTLTTSCVRQINSQSFLLSFVTMRTMSVA